MTSVNGEAPPALYCCMPSYGYPHRQAARQFWARSMSPTGPYKNMLRIQDDAGGSLLGQAFDYHWCNALNLQLQGHNISRFAMMHSDVVPADWWLDQLLDDLAATGADVMAASVAIKDTNGLTSTAIDDPNDPWDVLRRITVKETLNLPDLFGAAECDYPNHLLLANTGCWVCDFTKPWRHALNPDGTLAVNFEIRNAIFADRDKEGKLIGYSTKVRPEDWEFSRKVGRLGGKVMVSRRVKVSHMGEFPFPNDQYWGSLETDDVFLQRGKIQGPLKPEIPCVEGWLTEAEGKLLARYAEGQTVLEIGSFCGRSTIWMARVAEQVHCIDTFDGRGTPKPRDTYGDFQAALRRYEVAKKVTIHRCASIDALHDCPRLFDFAFIDGSHDAGNVATDVQTVLRVLKPEGLIAFHDYDSRFANDAGVREVVNELLDNGFERVDKADSLLVIRLSPVLQESLMAQPAFQE
jgi:hypothetical protein